MNDRVPFPPASVSLRPAASEERAVLQNLAQLYCYDFSEVLEMTELFVLRRFRRRGAGRAAAFAAFDLFTGAWEVRQREENPDATAFWRRAIGEYTRGNYEEARWERPEWSEIVQTFSTGCFGTRLATV